MKLETKRYLLLLTLVLAWDLLFTLAPILTHFGIDSRLIYRFFSPVCDQLDARSFHIFGSKLAVCSRCASIYFGFTFGLLIYPLTNSLRNVVVPRARYLIIPLAALIADYGVNYTSILQNTFVSRSITGGIFGVSLSYFVLPIWISLMQEFSRGVALRGMDSQEVVSSSSAKSESRLHNEK